MLHNVLDIASPSSPDDVALASNVEQQRIYGVFFLLAWTLFLCSSEGGVEQSDSCELSSSHCCACAVQFVAAFFPLQFFTPTLASGRRDGSLPPNLKRQSIVILNTINGNHCPLDYFPTLVAWAGWIRRSCLVQVAASSSLSVHSLHSAAFSVPLFCAVPRLSS